MQKIPKIIHYVWLGKGQKNDLFYKCLESWKKFCPDYEIKEWNEDNFDFSDCKYAMLAYKRKKYGFVSDYIRVRVLCEFGGVYFDTDTELTKPLDDLLSNDFVIGFENKYQCSTATIASAPNHELLKIMTNYYLKKEVDETKKLDITPNTVIITYFLKKYYNLKFNKKKQVLENSVNKNGKKVLVLPQEYFSPIIYTIRKLKQTENTYAIHYFNASWFTKSMKTREKFLKGVYYVFSPWVFDFFTKLWVQSSFKNIKKTDKKNNLSQFLTN